MTYKTVMRYQTSDGSVFESKAEANAHDSRLRFVAWYDNGRELFGQYEGCKVSSGETLDWLTLNWDKLKTFFEVAP